MAVQKGKEFNITAVLMALGGGSVASIVMDVAENKSEFIQSNPVTASLIPSIIGSAGIYFADDKFKPLFYGMLGTAGADVVQNLELIQGFSRVNYEIPPELPTPQETVQELAITESVLEGMNNEMSEMDIEEEQEIF